MKRRPKVTVTAEVITPKYETPSCPKCGEVCTASRAEYDMTGRPSVTETMEPCGCVLDWPMPTLAQDHAAAELVCIERIRFSTPAWWYAAVTGVCAGIVVLAAVALVWYGLRLPWGAAQTWNVAALGASLTSTLIYARLWLTQRAYESASRRLTATSDDDQGDA